MSFWSLHAIYGVVLDQFFIRLRRNTLLLAAGMNGGANALKLEKQTWVSFGEFRFDAPSASGGLRGASLEIEKGASVAQDAVTKNDSTNVLWRQYRSQIINYLLPIVPFFLFI